MNSFNIIIQATKSDNGLQTDYSSFYPNNESLEIASTLDDERSIPKIAGDKDAFSVQITKIYKIYSLIVGTSDVGGRPGFYSIRLYAPKNVQLTNVETILYQLRDKYISYPSTKTQQSQNYDEILSAIHPEVNTNNFIFLKSGENYGCYYDNISSSLATIFNSKGVHLTNKLYAFQRPKDGQSSTSEFRSFDELADKLKEIEIRGELRLLNEIKINDQKVEFDNRQKVVTLLCYKDDIIDYILSREGIYKTDPLTGSINIERKYIAPIPTPYREDRPAKSSFSDQYGGLILGCLMSFIIGFVGCFYLIQENYLPMDTTTAIPYNDYNSESKDHDNLSRDSISFSSVKDNSGTNYIANQPRLSNYIFRYAGNKWSYKNNNKSNVYVDFYSSNLDDFEYQSEKLKDQDKDQIVEALEKLSNQKIDERPTIKLKEKTEIKSAGNPPIEKRVDSKKVNGSSKAKGASAPVTKKRSGEVLLGVEMN